MGQLKGRVNLTIALFPFIFIAIGALLLYYWYTQQACWAATAGCE